MITCTDFNVFCKVHIKRVTLYKYKEADYNELQRKLDNVDWDGLIENSSVNYAWNKIIKLLINFRDNHIPKLHRNINTSSPWFTNAIRRVIKKRNKKN